MPANFSYVIPGKLAGSAKPGGWGDPRADLAGLARQGIGAVVSLTEEALDPVALRDVGLRYLHLPVPDFTPPALEQMDAFVRFVDDCAAEGMAVAVHCAAGIGRTGTMIAAYLVHTGMKADEAVRAVRRKRPGSIETREQVDSVREFAASRRRSR